MKWTRFAGTVACLAVATTAALSVAHAEDTSGDFPPNFPRMKYEAGLFLVNSLEARDHVGEDWLVGSLAYDVLRPTPSRAATISPYLDFGGGWGDSPLSDGYDHTFERSFAGVGLSSTLHITPPRQNFGAYAVAGAGLYLLDREDDRSNQSLVSDSDGPPVQQGDIFPLGHAVTVHPGFKFGAGLRFGHDLSLEGSYFGLGRLQGVDYSGVAVTFGLRI